VPVSPTRGFGLLERFLARKRAHRAMACLAGVDRSGAHLDIGSGAFPEILAASSFAERIALDRIPCRLTRADWVEWDLLAGRGLPFAPERFAAVTMLAVIEHLAPDHLPRLFRDVHRVLRPGGRLVITTPAAWTHLLLRCMAVCRLVSAIEIAEHQQQFTEQDLRAHLQSAGFAAAAIGVGTFEAGMNLWAVAER
jgi:SAM-dependent methyltransferase